MLAVFLSVGITEDDDVVLHIAVRFCRKYIFRLIMIHT